MLAKYIHTHTHAHTDAHTNLLHEQDVTQGHFIKWSLTGLNSVFLPLDWLPY